MTQNLFDKWSKQCLCGHTWEMSVGIQQSEEVQKKQLKGIELSPGILYASHEMNSK